MDTDSWLGEDQSDRALIRETFLTSRVEPEGMDALWEQGWRHFGEQFFRYSLAYDGENLRTVIPLRIRLAGFELSRSQRRVLAKNSDLETVIRPVCITQDQMRLFKRHRERFKRNVPESLYCFLSTEPAIVPCDCVEICLLESGELLAVSYLDIGDRSVSSIYGTFDPDESSRSLGILTMLSEIQFAKEQGKTFYYHGYCYDGPSFYDYKKAFTALEQYDWRGTWSDFQARSK